MTKKNRAWGKQSVIKRHFSLQEGKKILQSRKNNCYNGGKIGHNGEQMGHFLQDQSITCRVKTSFQVDPEPI
jgi:hypothetical protein